MEIFPPRRAPRSLAKSRENLIGENLNQWYEVTKQEIEDTGVVMTPELFLEAIDELRRESSPGLLKCLDQNGLRRRNAVQWIRKKKASQSSEMKLATTLKPESWEEVPEEEDEDGWILDNSYMDDTTEEEKRKYHYEYNERKFAYLEEESGCKVTLPAWRMEMIRRGKAFARRDEDFEFPDLEAEDQNGREDGNTTAASRTDSEQEACQADNGVPTGNGCER